MSTSLYQQFFLHHFVYKSQSCFPFINQKYKSNLHPLLDHSRKSIDLGYIKNYKHISMKYFVYTSNQKIYHKMTVRLMDQIIQAVYIEYKVFFQKGGVYRLLFNQQPNIKQNAYIQQLLLIKLYQFYQQNKTTYKSLDKFILSFFFTLNFIKTCNLQAKCFANLLYWDNQQQNQKNSNIYNVLMNFILRRLSFESSQQQNSQQISVLQDEILIRTQSFQKVLKILSRQQCISQITSLISIQNSISNTISFSTIKSSSSQHDQSLRTLIAFEILVNFIKNNHVRFTQIKLYRLLKLINLSGVEKLHKGKDNQFLKLKNWEDVIQFCFHKIINSNDHHIYQSNRRLDNHQTNNRKTNNHQTNNIETDNNQTDNQANNEITFQHILLMQICKRNFNISENIFSQQQLSFQTLQNYRQQTFQFILGYLKQLFESKNEQQHQLYTIFLRCKQIYNYGQIVLRPLVEKILRHQSLHQIYKKNLDKCTKLNQSI